MRREKLAVYYCILLCCFMVTVCFAGTTTSIKEAKKQSEVKERKVVARVNGKPVYEDQLTPEVKKGLKKFKKYGMRKDSPEMEKRLQKKALGRVIDYELIAQESRKLKIKDVDKKVEEKLQALKNKYQTEERLNNYLKMKGLTTEELKINFNKRIYMDEYLKIKGISDPDIPEKNIREFYDDNPKNYHREEAVKVSHILIKVDEKATHEEEKKARQKAEQLRKDILGGKDFAEIAKEHSECNSASGGGGLGYINKGYMPEEFEKIAFSLDKDVVSEPVKTKFGYHIIKVSEKSPEGITPYEEVRDFIKKFLQEGETKKKLAAHTAELKKKAKIEVFLD